MRNFKIFIATILVVVMFCSSYNTVLATDDAGEIHHHDYTACFAILVDEHPHKVEYVCECGASIPMEKAKFDGCLECRKALCQEGIHYYLDTMYEANGYFYGECYCGRIMVLSNLEDYVDHVACHSSTYNVWECKVCEWARKYSGLIGYQYNYKKLYYKEPFSYVEVNDEYYSYYNSYENFTSSTDYMELGYKKCPWSNNGSHYYECNFYAADEHPHRGSFGCFCGENIYFSKTYSAKCELCSKELCELGIHDYLSSICYENSHGYGTCHCGIKKAFSYDNLSKYETCPGVISKDNILACIKHPHLIYDYEKNIYQDENSSIILDECSACKIQKDYEQAIHDYAVDTILNEKTLGNFINTDNIYEEADEYPGDDDNVVTKTNEEELDSELEEWLKQMKEVLNS